ncbi:MAG: geranylgeranylglycerol-phosphate geranylgeranyltransferase [Candidatus Hodarchaeales archaeon]|jgi:geranylgeranylglycerol-phosphate geranylgeranyltransferase
MSLKGFFFLVRPLNATLSGFTVLIGAIAAISSPLDEAVVIGIIIGCATTSLLAMGGYVINDVFDIEIDKINTPHRPLPQGEVTIRQAKIFSYILFIIGVGITLLIPDLQIPSFLLAFFGGILLYLYAAYFKRLGLVGNVVVGTLVAIPFIFGGLLTKSDSLIYPATFAFMLNVGREIVKDIEDVHGDQLEDVKSVALQYGVKPARNLAFLVLFSLVLFDPLPILLRVYKTPVFIVLLITIDLIIIYTAFLLFNKTEEEIIVNTTSSKRLLKTCMSIGVVAFVFEGLTNLIEILSST